ncbi:MAG TPA: chloride channel protein [Bryobacteraceae bacterium]|nr:chloride channel protein [Bryobacteraceae bacterium]
MERIIGATLSAGILAGLGAVAFHYLANRLDEELFIWAAARPLYVVGVPTFGLFCIGWFLQLVPESRLGGVLEVIESLNHLGGKVSLVRLYNVVASALVLAVGGSVGPEGPMVQMGAVAGSQAGQLFGLSGATLRTLVRAGTAAGVAAAFRSPAGGVLLTLEIFGAKLNRDLTAIAVASGLGYLLRTTILRDAYPFRPPTPLEPLPLLTLLTVVPVMGLLAAPTGHFFISMFRMMPALFPESVPLWLRLTLGGLIIGILGIWFPQVLSAGYPTILSGLYGKIGVSLFIVLLFLKMFATSVTFGSGAVGGLFAPTLVIGSLFGGAFGYGLRAVWPEAVPQPELFVLLGMIVMFGSIVKGYLSGLLMIADMSGCYHQLLLPGVIAGGISYLVSWELHDKSIFGLALDRTSDTIDNTGTNGKPAMEELSCGKR